jgi:plastocyanin
MTSSGFDPANITVKKGTKVTFVNTDSRPRWPASDPHPSHTDYPQLDPKKAVSAGASWEFTADKVGTWGIHDHLIPTHRGKITVTD